MPDQMAQAQARINERQAELHRVADVLAREAQYLRRRGGINRVALIALGALTATQAGLEQLGLVPKPYLSLLFLAMGVLVAVIAGVEAAFKFESKGAELLALATSCHSMVRQSDSVWYRNVGAEDDPTKQLAGAHQVIEFQQAKLDEVQEKAAALGVNVALEVRRVHSRSLRRMGGRDDDDDDDLDNHSGDDSRAPSRRRPYAA